MRIILILISAILISSCSKEDKAPQTLQKTGETENPADTNLTPEEKFSTSILADFIGNSEDEELAEYLETEIYKMGAGFKGASLVEISPAVWFIMLEKDGITRNYLLQKYVNFKTNEYYFTFKETPLTITDIVSKRKVNTPAGEMNEP